jgi:aminoglycoside phosphotransferase (APT) family kinase protein
MSETETQAADVIDLRADEQLDATRLETYLKGKLAGSDGALRIRQFGGGHANLTYLLQYGEGEKRVEYVLRRPPHGKVGVGAHDMKREYRGLSKLWREFPKAPRALLLCEDHEILGADFFVMERIPGVVVRREIPEHFGGGRDAVANRKLSEVVIDTLVEFHAVEPVTVGLADIGKPEGFLERQVRGWTRRYEDAKTHDYRLAEELTSWLIAKLPASQKPTLLHNDWKLDNVAVSPEDPGQCVAVYDWDMCTIGDPLCDLGTMMASWIDPGEEEVGVSSMPTLTPGFMDRAEAIARYGSRSRRDVTGMPYYLVFGTFKMAVVLQQLYVRYHRGETQDARFAGMQAGAERLFERAAAYRP